MATLSVGQKVVMHLSRFKRMESDNIYNIPWDVTQDGIAAALRISRAHASIELKKLREAGKVEEKLAHIKNGKVKRKAYLLTQLGFDDAASIEEFARKEKIDIAGLLDLKRQDPVILLGELCPEDRLALGCACAFQVPVSVSSLPETKSFTIPSDVKGMTVISEQLRENILSAATLEERKVWHGFAAEYWFDRKLRKDPDYWVYLPQLLYHYIESCRDRDACRLVNSEKYRFISIMDDDLHDLLQRLKIIDMFAEGALTVIIRSNIEYEEASLAEERIKELEKYNAAAAELFMADVEMLRGDAAGAKKRLSAMQCPEAKIRLAGIMREEGDLAGARDMALSADDVSGTENGIIGVEKFIELAKIDMADKRYSDAYARISKIHETVNNPVCEKKLSALRRELKMKL